MKDKLNFQRSRAVIDVNQIENALIEFVIKERLPLSKLNSVYLNKLIDGKY